MASESNGSRISRRKFLSWGAAAAAAVGVTPILAACSQPAAPAAAPTAAPAPKAAVIELKLDQHEPAQGNLGRTYQQYADAVNQDAAGRLHITVYPAETLSKAADTYMNAVNGVCDMAWTAPSYTPGQFALTEGFNLPMQGFANGKHGARAYTAWYKASPIIQKEWENIHVLATYANGAGFIYTTKKPINKLEDTNGLKVRATGPGNTNLVKALGANPVPTSVPESYEALSKGIIDAGIYDWQAVNSQKLFEVLKYNLTLPLAFSAQVMAVNKKKWDSIPADLQKILEMPPSLVWQTWDPVNKGKPPTLGEFFANGFDVADAPGIEEFKKAGGQLTTTTAEEQAKWQAVAKPVWATWSETVKDKFDGMKELAAFQEIIAKTK